VAIQWVDSGLPYLTDPGDRELGVRVAFTSRLGGESATPFESLNLSMMVGDIATVVDRNRRLAEEAAGFELGSMALLKQLHGSGLCSAEPGSSGVIGEGDAVVVRKSGVTATVLAADCVPVLLAGDQAAVAAHAGWRGLVAGVIEEAVAAVGRPTKAWVGPSIRACCYEVGADVIGGFTRRDLPVHDEGHVDPGAAAVALLERAGVGDISVSDICTSCDDRFYSHRRDGVTGRQAALIAWR
jgi:hypothetical protein